jgi:hypothetical protein
MVLLIFCSRFTVFFVNDEVVELLDGLIGGFEG